MHDGMNENGNENDASDVVMKPWASTKIIWNEKCIEDVN